MNNITHLLQSIYDLVDNVPSQQIEHFCLELDMTVSLDEVDTVIQKFQPFEIRQFLNKFCDYWIKYNSELNPPHVSSIIKSALFTYEKERNRQNIELVCTGPTSVSSTLRHTYESVIELIRNAKKEIFLVTYVIYDIDNISKELVECAERGVQIRFVVEVNEKDVSDCVPHKIKNLDESLLENSQIYYWPLENRKKLSSGDYGIIHAKCIVVDRSNAFISSANLTGYALDHNIELGVLIKNGDIPGQVVCHFDELISTKILKKLIQ